MICRRAPLHAIVTRVRQTQFSTRDVKIQFTNGISRFVSTRPHHTLRSERRLIVIFFFFPLRFAFSRNAAVFPKIQYKSVRYVTRRNPITVLGGGRWCYVTAILKSRKLRKQTVREIGYGGFSRFFAFHQ